MKFDCKLIEKKIVSALQKIYCRCNGHWTTARRTREVKQSLSVIGDKLGFEVYNSDHSHEWLYDLCWCDEDDSGLVLDMPLTLESEWAQDFDALLVDFQKILISSAQLRVFVFSQPTQDDWDDCCVLLMEQIHKFRISKNGDRYLFCCWLPDGWQFKHYIHPQPVPQVNHIWLFGANKELYDLSKKLKHRKQDWWSVVQYREHRLRPHDQVILWQSGEDAGIYGLGELTSGTYQVDEHWRTDINYTRLLKEPILRSELCTDKLLRNLAVIKMPRGRNPFKVSKEEWIAIRKLID